jgi:hypothetical protein
METRRLCDIDPDEVARCFARNLGRKTGRYAANRTLALLRTMFNPAGDWRFFSGPNPIEELRVFHEEKRERFLPPDKLRRVNEALSEELNQFGRAYSHLEYEVLAIAMSRKAWLFC